MVQGIIKVSNIRKGRIGRCLAEEGECMKILILVMILTNAEMSVFGQSYLDRFVSIFHSPEEVAIEVYHREQAKRMYDHWDSKLYEIDLTDKTIKEIPIPKVEFKAP